MKKQGHLQQNIPITQTVRLTKNSCNKKYLPSYQKITQSILSKHGVTFLVMCQNTQYYYMQRLINISQTGKPVTTCI